MNYIALAREALNKAMQKQYTPPREEYSELAKAIIGICKANGGNDVAVSGAENALAHAYMCGFNSGAKQESKRLMAELEKPLV